MHVSFYSLRCICRNAAERQMLQYDECLPISRMFPLSPDRPPAGDTRGDSISPIYVLIILYGRRPYYSCTADVGLQ